MADEKENIKKELEDALNSGSGSKISRFALSVVSGLIPFAGGALGGGASIWSEREQEYINSLFSKWLKMQEDEIKEIGQTMFEVMVRIDQNDERTRERIQSQEYLSLVKKCFRDWSAAESETKRGFIRNLLSNAASCTLATDDVIRLFIEWIDNYSETHFKVISTIYKSKEITRLSIWQKIYGENVREDSPEADLFKLVIHDLSLGHIIRQHRQTDYNGRFIKPQTKKPQTQSNIYKSAFDDVELYELTNLGRQFVHYTMNEIVPKITDGSEHKNSE